ncbi:MAG: 2-hydroxychromene-2-carboxylate isomerase [Pseudomonadota bacterium]
MAQIDYYFSVLSPFTYLAGLRLEETAAAHGAAIRYKPLDIVSLFGQTGGTPPKDRHPSRQAYRLQEMKRGALHAGLPMNMAPAHWPTDPTPASHALIAAQEAGFAVGPLAHAFLRAVWAQDRNIAEPAVVSELLSANGVSESVIAPHMAGAAAIYAKNLEDAVAGGVFGAPFYVVGEEMFWGADRIAHLGHHLAALKS